LVLDDRGQLLPPRQGFFQDQQIMEEFRGYVDRRTSRTRIAGLPLKTSRKFQMPWETNSLRMKRWAL
jgi:hypothetical protein